MSTKIIIFLFLHIIVLAEEQPFLDLKKVIRGALDVVAAVPTSTIPINYNLGNPSQVTTSNGIQGIDPIIRERFSRLFHIPPDFVHRLAAQAGFIDYEPTTAKPFSNHWSKFKPHESQVNQEYTTSAFIQEDPSVTSNTANDFSGIIQEKRQVAREQNNFLLSFCLSTYIFHSGNLFPILCYFSYWKYYQPFGDIPEGSQPKMIIYGGRLYIATPLLSEKHVQQVTVNSMVTQNPSEIADKKEEDNQPITHEPNEGMHYHRIYEKHIKAAGDEQAQTAKFQQVIVPDALPIEILGIESKAKAYSPYRKVYKKELENYDALHQFILEKQPHEIGANLAKDDSTRNGLERKVISFQPTTSVPSYNQPAKLAANFAGKTENSNLPSYQLSLNKKLKQYDGIDNMTFDRLIKKQMMTSTQQANELAAGTLSQKKIEKNENAEFTSEKQSMRRILALRSKMAADRRKFAERKQLLLSMKRKIFRRHCYNIRSLAQQFGFTDIKQYVLSNCIFIENYYPEFKCREADVSIHKCLRLFE
ncbi:hypothetical protein X798_02471 [Onchocerca flexuosa]|uniref:aECM cysteine-cradle domain-containing protein n=1 Tax=Onchocerca flexuosa TaxID=387005 RepID=A0A238C0F7_9BILA|nr:hypothetical protein X798_02471 [Onchocerca flexuosa]